MIRNAISVLAFVATAASPAFAQTHGQLRERFWFSGGVGVGSMGCRRCDALRTSLFGDVAVGGTLSDKMQIALAATAWTKSEAGNTLLIATLAARFRLFSSVDGGAHVIAGVGLGGVNGAVNFLTSPNNAYDEPEVGFSLEVGGGYDIRIRPTLSLTPFARLVYVKTPSADAVIPQIGLSITGH